MTDSYHNLLRSLRRWRDARALIVGFVIGCGIAAFLAVVL